MDDLTREIKLYSQYSTSEKWVNWYAKILPFKAKRTIKILRTYKSPDAVLLDVGCSTGLTLGFIAQEFKKVIGYDIDQKAIEVAKKRFEKRGLKTKFLLGKGDKIPLKDNSVDITTSIEVFEHVDQPLVMLTEIHRVLKPDGILHITTANKLWPIEPHFHLPFLSYLPPRLADLYVRVTKRGKGYGNIKLPTYRQFRKTVEKYFQVEDITLEVIRNYKEYDFEKERGKIIILTAAVLSFLKKLNLKFIENILLNLSLGWFFICRPKKK